MKPADKEPLGEHDTEALSRQESALSALRESQHCTGKGTILKLDHKDPAESVKTLRSQRHKQRNPEFWELVSQTGQGLTSMWGAIAHTTETHSQNLIEKISKSLLRKRKTKTKGWKKKKSERKKETFWFSYLDARSLLNVVTLIVSKVELCNKPDTFIIYFSVIENKWMNKSYKFSEA